jgi:uncharacterized protein (TIGR02145 family)
MKKLLFLFSAVVLLVTASCNKDNPDGLQTGLDPDGYFLCDGLNYGYKVYGTQTWMTDNVGYLPYVVPSSTKSDTIPYYYVLGYEGTNPLAAKATENFQKYGVLYNWAAAKKNACPPGWHLPTDLEWQKLEIYLNFLTEITDRFDWMYCLDASDHRKMRSTTGWINGNGTNSSGFNVKPAGSFNGSAFANLGEWGMFWTLPPYPGCRLRMNLSWTDPIRMTTGFTGATVKNIREDPSAV